MLRHGLTRRAGAERTGFNPRLRDAAFLIPVFALLLMLPPFLNLFRAGRLLFGIPLEVVYLFAIWAALVLAAALLSRHMPDQPESGGEAHSPDPDTADRT